MKTDNRKVVRLDVFRIPNGIDIQRAYVIAEALLHICGVMEIWDEPKHGYRLFLVREMPQDVPQAGIYWIKV